MKIEMDECIASTISDSLDQLSREVEDHNDIEKAHEISMYVCGILVGWINNRDIESLKDNSNG